MIKCINLCLINFYIIINDYDNTDGVNNEATFCQDYTSTFT